MYGSEYSKEGGPLCTSLPEWDALGDGTTRHPKVGPRAPKPSMEPPKLRPKEKEKFGNRKKREQAKFIALQKKRDKDREKRKRELRHMLKQQRDERKAEAARKWEDEKPQREAAAARKKAVEDWNKKREEINKKKIEARRAQLGKSKIELDGKAKTIRTNQIAAAEKRAQEAQKRQLERAKTRHEATVAKARELGIKEKDLPVFDETAAAGMGSSAAEAIKFSATIEKKHSMMMERQKSHMMDIKHNEARDKMAEDVESRITAENALRQQYRFDLEEGNKTPFIYVSCC